MTSILGYCIPRGIRIQKLSIFPHFYPQNRPNMGVNRRFQAKRAKYSNFCIIETTNVIAAKFCTVITTIKFSLCWRRRATILTVVKCDISAIIWSILMKFVWRCTLIVRRPKNWNFFFNLRLWTAAILKIEKNDISYSNFDKILHGGVDLGFGLQTLGRYGKDGEDGDLK